MCPTASVAVAAINVGLLTSAYLILDEPHLYPLSQEGKDYRGALKTIIELLRQLEGLTRFVFMSATLSRPLVERLSQLLKAEIIEADEQELTLLQAGRVRILERAQQPLSAAAVLASHDGSSLVVCNQVERAQQLYLDLDELIRARGLSTRLMLLHSRFSDEDRRRQGEELRRLLGKDAWQSGTPPQQDVIVVATQVVEVGLDISVQTLHTELSPANSLVQRAGRCARFPGQQGRVIVYPLPEEEQGHNPYLPYRADLCESTWQALAPFAGQALGFAEERALLDQVHSADDLALLKRYEDNRPNLQEAIEAALQKPHPSVRSTLIRDDLQVLLLIHDRPEEEIEQTPWRWQTFALRPSLLQGKHWEALQRLAQEADLDWVCKEAVPLAEEQDRSAQGDEEEDSRVQTRYAWQPVTNPSQIPNTLVLAMPQQLVTYDPDLGLVFRDGRLSLPARWQQRLASSGYQSMPLKSRQTGREGGAVSRQRYEEHINGLADAYHYALRHDLAYAMQRLEERLQLPEGVVDQAIQLALALHDLGKLNREWQAWARAWERLYHEQRGMGERYREPEADYLFAKTTYDAGSREQRAWQRQVKPPRPRHACESVALARTLIKRSLEARISDTKVADAVLNAVCYAIAHHHAVKAHQYGAVVLPPEAMAAVERALELVRRDDTRWSYDVSLLRQRCQEGDLFPENAAAGKFTLPKLSSQKRYETWLAFLITRALRLADQRADYYRGR
jgi:CRISPR-associated endonuclease/helicase Cas3